MARIIVVHDDESFRLLLEEAFIGHGHAVAAFAGPLAAWDEVASADIGALITRVRFWTEGPHGVALSRWAVFDRPGVRVFFTGPPELAKHTEGIGALLPTPLLPREVARIVSATLTPGTGALADDTFETDDM
jgi:hypothetical protein